MKKEVLNYYFVFLLNVLYSYFQGFMFYVAPVYIFASLLQKTFNPFAYDFVARVAFGLIFSAWLIWQSRVAFTFATNVESVHKSKMEKNKAKYQKLYDEAKRFDYESKTDEEIKAFIDYIKRESDGVIEIDYKKDQN